MLEHLSSSLSKDQYGEVIYFGFGTAIVFGLMLIIPR